MPVVVFLLAAALALAAPTALLAAPVDDGAASPLEARARSLRVRHALCPYSVHRLDKKTLGLKGVRWLEIKCKHPNKVVTFGAEQVKCRQMSYKARFGDGRTFRVGAGCVATLVPAGLPAKEVVPDVAL